MVLFAPIARRLLVFYCFSERLIKHSCDELWSEAASVTITSCSLTPASETSETWGPTQCVLCSCAEQPELQLSGVCGCFRQISEDSHSDSGAWENINESKPSQTHVSPSVCAQEVCACYHRDTSTVFVCLSVWVSCYYSVCWFPHTYIQFTSEPLLRAHTGLPRSARWTRTWSGSSSWFGSALLRTTWWIHRIRTLTCCHAHHPPSVSRLHRTEPASGLKLWLLIPSISLDLCAYWWCWLGRFMHHSSSETKSCFRFLDPGQHSFLCFCLFKRVWQIIGIQYRQSQEAQFATKMAESKLLSWLAVQFDVTPGCVSCSWEKLHSVLCCVCAV